MTRSTVSFVRIFRLVFSVGVAALIGSLAVPTAASTISLNTPTGLNPGDRFRIAFVTGTTTAGISSSDIASYNLFVNTAAGGATYNGSAVTFYAIGSTATVNAYDNIHSTTLNDPVYLAGGALVAPSITGANGLWSGALVNRIATDIDGTVVSPDGGGNDREVFTGTLVDGTASSAPLGYYQTPVGFRPGEFVASIGQATGAPMHGGSTRMALAQPPTADSCTVFPRR